MRNLMRWLAIIASLAFAGGPVRGASIPARGRDAALRLALGDGPMRSASTPSPRAVPPRDSRSSQSAAVAARHKHKSVAAPAHVIRAAYHPRQSAAGASSPAKSSTPKKKTKKRRVSRRSSHFVLKQKAPTPDRISEIQSALARGGYYQGNPNGKWDAGTQSALEKFQSANALAPTGKLDATSLQKLGLGSDIAGVSAPKPPATQPPPSAPSAAPPKIPQSSPQAQPQPAAKTGSVSGPQ